MATKKKAARKKKRTPKGPTLTLNAERLVPGTIELVPVEGLKPHPKNPRKGNKGIIRESVEANDFYGIVIGQRSSGRIIAGWHRVLAAREEKVPKLPVEWLDVDDEKAERIMLVDNRAGDKARYDDDKLLALLKGLDRPSIGTGYDDRALLKILGSFQTTDADDQDLPKKPIAKPGDIWALGDHKLLCGSCLDDERFDSGSVLTLTDPPYNVDYQRSKSERGGNAKVHSPYREGKTSKNTLSFMQNLFADVLVMTYPVDRHFQQLAKSLVEARFEIRRELIWVKDRFSFWPGSKYQQKHEPILVCARKNAAVVSNVPANVSTVFEVNRPTAHKRHPTEKPLELWSKFIEFHSCAGDLIYDPFLGSGTTLVACEQLGRRCTAVEIMPEFCDVAIERWQNFTGKKAKRAARSKA